MSKPAKPAAPAAGDQPPKSKKMLVIIIAVVVLLAAAGAGYYFLVMKPHSEKHAKPAATEEAADEGDEEDEAKPKVPPKFVEIGTFTANLMHEDADRYLQVAITIKLNKPELEEKVKESNPEIQHRINMLLQSKRPSELATPEGKEILASDIKANVEYVLGLRKTQPALHQVQPSAEGETHHAAAEEKPSKKGVAEVLFTSFIIQ
jgi:flagellar FliL protein